MIIVTRYIFILLIIMLMHFTFVTVLYILINTFKYLCLLCVYVMLKINFVFILFTLINSFKIICEVILNLADFTRNLELLT